MIRRILSLVALLSVGCVQVTEPVGDIDTAEPDEALVGKWKSANEKNEDALAIDIPEVKGNPKGLMRAAEPGNNKNKPTWFFVSAIGKEKFLNWCDSHNRDQQAADFSMEGEYAKWAASKHRAYWVAKCRVEKDECVLNIGDEKAFKMIAEEAKLIK